MTEYSPTSNGTTVSHRHTRFTPENIRRITDLVERGISREEIAEVIGVTPGTLAVTCSRLKVSLRRPRVISGARQAQRPRSIGGERRPAGPKKLDIRHERSGRKSAAVSGGSGAHDMQSARLAIQMTFKGAMRTINLPVPGSMIGQLALEAEVRDMRLPELVAELLKSILKRGLFQLVLEDSTIAEGAHASELILKLPQTFTA
jgi:hypothetical protein